MNSQQNCHLTLQRQKSVPSAEAGKYEAIEALQQQALAAAAQHKECKENT